MITVTGLLFSNKFYKRNIRNLLQFFFELIKTVMEINPLGGLFVDDSRYRLFLVEPSWTSDLDIFSRNVAHC